MFGLRCSLNVPIMTVQSAGNMAPVEAGRENGVKLQPKLYSIPSRLRVAYVMEPPP